MNLKIAVLAGDGIGPEISEQGVSVLTAVAEKFGHQVSYKSALCGAAAIDAVGDPFPEETFNICQEADAVLFSAVGDPKFDNNPSALYCYLNSGFKDTGITENYSCLGEDWTCKELEYIPED